MPPDKKCKLTRPTARDYYQDYGNASSDEGDSLSSRGIENVDPSRTSTIESAENTSALGPTASTNIFASASTSSAFESIEADILAYAGGLKGILPKDAGALIAYTLISHTRVRCIEGLGIHIDDLVSLIRRKHSTERFSAAHIPIKDKFQHVQKLT
jgi:hypothetical protein